MERCLLLKEKIKKMIMQDVHFLTIFKIKNVLPLTGQNI